MPDLISHTLFILPSKRRFPTRLIYLLIGSILPDLLGRILGVFISDTPIIGWYQTVVHTPFSLVLFSYSLSFLFPEKERKTIFSFLLIGISSHIFLDIFQKNIGTGYLWFFPFSFSSFQVPLIWPDESIFLIPIFLFANFVYFKLIYRK